VAVTNIPGARGATGFAEFVNGPEREPNRLMVMGLPLLAALARGKTPVGLDRTTPIARLTAEYFAIAVPSDSPITGARDLAEALRADPTKVTWGGGALGSVDHVLAALFAKATGADPARLAYAPYFGPGEMIGAVLEGRITAAIGTPRQFEEQVAAGRLRLVGVTSRTRISGLEATTLIEQGIEVELANWRGVLAPAGLPAENKAGLAGAIDEMVRAPAWEEVRRQKGWHEAHLSGEAFAAFLQKEQARVSDALRSVGLGK
jgi:putative tricarboxylic transport membrane protein